MCPDEQSTQDTAGGCDDVDVVLLRAAFRLGLTYARSGSGAPTLLAGPALGRWARDEHERPPPYSVSNPGVRLGDLSTGSAGHAVAGSRTALAAPASYAGDVLACFAGLGPARKIKYRHMLCGGTVLLQVARYHPEQLLACLAELDAPQKFELLRIQDEDGWTALMHVARYHPEQLLACLDEIAGPQSVELLKIQNKDGWTAVEISTGISAGTGVAVPGELTGVPSQPTAGPGPSLLSTAIVGGGRWRDLSTGSAGHAVAGSRTALAAPARDAGDVLACFAGLSTAIKINYRHMLCGGTVLLQVARYHPEQLLACLAELDAPQKFELLRIQDEDGWTALMHVARYHPEQLLACLDEIAGPQSVELLKIQNKDGWTAVEIRTGISAGTGVAVPGELTGVPRQPTAGPGPSLFSTAIAGRGRRRVMGRLVDDVRPLHDSSSASASPTRSSPTAPAPAAVTGTLVEQRLLVIAESTLIQEGDTSQDVTGDVVAVGELGDPDAGSCAPWG